ncbi:heat shock transcription factor, X-linked-like [Lagopus muta]|uniref:heat shock transcription factor, X-linked-like n=2 Tax=Lagopus muta TaxID=64668 RepID=UPI00209D454E|nr:heat shock transcription factor, X-linked-like [Lagopus muta]XP_048800672.1 heat shock transcription factor, X-linked-like [Lagopus muta]XP_048800674.1 heat shock transcription factor, X-linked-like [Lagopus muta]XP_048800675.1 heat shock transcription factor, X-linked-like [Lagopus muta]XP_048800676.1 heat shock transcription factor, X-linked-like [Lagopus muta]XP_048800687.1 heat shock transcription factor, X-linked-like [Lagopus muta]
METPSSETSGVSVPSTESAVSASAARRLGAKRAAAHAALGPLQEEKASPFSPGEVSAKRRCRGLSEQCCGYDSDMTSCSFLNTLWKVVESVGFQSIRWGDEGDFIVIEEAFFRAEVLARGGTLQVFDVGNMKDFVRRLHQHGFYITDADLPTSAPCAQFLAQGASISTPSQLLCYYHPYFQRDRLQCQRRFKRSLGARRRPASSLQAFQWGWQEGQQSRSLQPEMQSGAAARAGSELPVGSCNAAPAAAAAAAHHSRRPAPSGPFPPGLRPDSGAGGDGVGRRYNLRPRKRCRWQQ